MYNKANAMQASRMVILHYTLYILHYDLNHKACISFSFL